MQLKDYEGINSLILNRTDIPTVFAGVCVHLSVYVSMCLYVCICFLCECPFKFYICYCFLHVLFALVQPACFIIWEIMSIALVNGGVNALFASGARSLFTGSQINDACALASMLFSLFSSVGAYASMILTSKGRSLYFTCNILSDTAKYHFVDFDLSRYFRDSPTNTQRGL